MNKYVGYWFLTLVCFLFLFAYQLHAHSLAGQYILTVSITCWLVIGFRDYKIGTVFARILSYIANEWRWFCFRRYMDTYHNPRSNKWE